MELRKVSQADQLDVQIGGLIAARRREVGLSQGLLADHVGLSFQQIQRYETGRNRVSVSTLVHIAASLDTSVSQLVGEAGVGAGELIRESLLTHPHAMELLDAYAGVSGVSLRAAVVKMVQVVSRMQGPGVAAGEREEMGA